MEIREIGWSIGYAGLGRTGELVCLFQIQSLRSVFLNLVSVLSVLRSPRVGLSSLTLNFVISSSLQHGPDDKQSSDVSLPRLGDASVFSFSAGRILAWHEAQPRGEAATCLEIIHRWAERLNSESSGWANAGHRLHASHFLVFSCVLAQCFFIGINLLGERYFVRLAERYQTRAGDRALH